MGGTVSLSDFEVQVSMLSQVQKINLDGNHSFEIADEGIVSNGTLNPREYIETMTKSKVMSYDDNNGDELIKPFSQVGFDNTGLVTIHSKVGDSKTLKCHGIVTSLFYKDDVEIIVKSYGVLIGPNIVLTSSQSVYNHTNVNDCKVGIASKVTFLPLDSNQEFNVIDYSFQESRDQDPKLDFALLFLEYPLGYKQGYYGVGVMNIKHAKHSIINMINDFENTTETPFLHGEVKEVTDDFLYHDVKFASNMLGRALIMELDGKAYVIGIQSESNIVDLDNWNRAVIFTKTNLSFFLDSEKSFNKKQNSLGSYFSIRKLWIREIYEGRGLKYLIKLPLYQMRVLKLSKCEISCEGMNAFEAKSTTLEFLEELDLSKNNIKHFGVKSLNRCSSLANLLCLNLAENNLLDQGSLELSKNSVFVNLVLLNLSKNGIKAPGAWVIGTNQFWSNLRKLIFNHNFIESVGLKGLLSNKSWIHLGFLELVGCFVGTEGVKEIKTIENCPWTELKGLDLAMNNLNNESLLALSDQTSFTKVEVLNIDLNNAIDFDYNTIVKLFNGKWKNLSHIYYNGENLLSLN